MYTLLWNHIKFLSLKANFSHSNNKQKDIHKRPRVFGAQVCDGLWVSLPPPPSLWGEWFMGVSGPGTLSICCQKTLSPLFAQWKHSLLPVGSIVMLRLRGFYGGP